MKAVVSILLLLLSLATAAGQIVPDQPKRAPIDTLRAEGYDALYNLDYEGARKRFQKMIELAPDHPAGAQCLASSFWVQQLNEAWELKATLFSDDAYANSKTPADRSRIDEFRKWTRRAKQLAEARLRKDSRDVEARYFLGAAEGLEAAFAASVEKKYMSAMRTGSSSVDHHRDVIKLAPEFHDAELTIGLYNYIIGSLPLPLKMMVGTFGVRGSKKRGLEMLERVSVEGQWARDVARVLLVDLYKREKRWTDAIKTARELSERYPRNYLFKLQVADALTSQIVTLRQTKAATAVEEKELTNIFESMARDKSLDKPTVELVHLRWKVSREQLARR